MKWKILVLFIYALLVYSSALYAGIQEPGKLVTYVMPSTTIANKQYKVYARVQGNLNWQNVFVNIAKVNIRNTPKSGQCGFSYFDSNFNKPIEVKVIYANSFDNVQIRPSNYNITYKRTDNSIIFTIVKPQNLSVEFDNDRINNLQIFANPLEVNPPKEGDPNVIYFGPGIHNVNNVPINDNQTIYIHGGAIVNGLINVYNKSGITICGRGILNGGGLPHLRGATRPNLLKIKNGNNINIEGIVVIDSPDWGIYISKCINVNITNVKTINYMINGDGFDIDGCTNVTASNMYIRSADDNISLKSLDGTACTGVNIKNSVLWADNAHNMLVGPESRGAKFSDIHFDNMIVLENTETSMLFSGVMSIMASDKGAFFDISWNSIYVDNISGGQMISIQYAAAFSKDNTYGQKISGVSFSNIFCSGNNIVLGKILGIDNNRDVENVSIKNFNINGQPVSSNIASKLTGTISNIGQAQRLNPSIKINDNVKNLRVN